MTRYKVDAMDEFLSFLDQSIARNEVIPLEESYLEKIKSLVEGVTVDLDQPLPDEDEDEIRLH
jgi:hypothetical protein